MTGVSKTGTVICGYVICVWSPIFAVWDEKIPVSQLPLSVRVGLPQKRDGDGEGEQKRLNLARAVQVVITKFQVVIIR